jgi:Arsenical resistance operon protein ArsD
MSNSIVAELLKSEGNAALPVTLIDGELFVKGRYPKYDEIKNGKLDEIKKVKIKKSGCCGGSGCC